MGTIGLGPRGRAGGECSPLPLWTPGVLQRKFFKKTDAKSCILVASALITAKKLGGDQYIVCPPTYKLGDQSPPVPTVVAPMIWSNQNARNV